MSHLPKVDPGLLWQPQQLELLWDELARAMATKASCCLKQANDTNGNGLAPEPERLPQSLLQREQAGKG